jgi:hypothetical protein
MSRQKKHPFFNFSRSISEQFAQSRQKSEGIVMPPLATAIAFLKKMNERQKAL